MGVNDLTPAMRQYLEVKERYPDCIIFFRMGDFYEMFFEDAVTASRVLEITLTSRNKNREDAIPLCGFPHHAASSYIAKLIEKGFKVAVCEQMEDPKAAKGVVKRSGDPRGYPRPCPRHGEPPCQGEQLSCGADVSGAALFGLAFVDISTGEFRVPRRTTGSFPRGDGRTADPRNPRRGEDLAGRRPDPVRRRGGGALSDQPLAAGLRFEGDGPSPFCDHFRRKSCPESPSNPHPAAGSCSRRRPCLHDRRRRRTVSATSTSSTWYESGAHLSPGRGCQTEPRTLQHDRRREEERVLFHVLDETVTSLGGRGSAGG